MLNILDKFENIEIKQTDNISDIDKQYCEEQQKIYDRLYNLYDKLHNESILIQNEISECKNKYNNSITLSGNMSLYQIASIKNYLTENYFLSLLYYFEKQYNIKFNSSKAKNSLKLDHKIHYENVLEEMSKQMNGMNLDELALNQLQKNLKQTTKTYREDNKKVIINKNKISINNYLYFREWFGNVELSYNYKDNLRLLFEALTYQEIHEIKLKEEYKNIITKLSEQFKPDFEINNSIIKKIKFYKNGKINIWFNNSDIALEFAKQFLSI